MGVNRTMIVPGARNLSVIKLDGADGEHDNLIRYARRLAKQLCLNPDKVVFEMEENNYKDIVMTFDKYFGEYVVLETDQFELSQ